MDAMEEFGQWLKRRRRSLGFTQVELGRLTGYASETLRKVEAGEQRPSRQMAEQLAQHLDIALEEREQFIRFARSDTTGNQLLPLPSPTPPASMPTAVPPVMPQTMSSGQPRRAGLIPTELSSFIGREKELAGIAQLLLRPDVRLLTVTGPPGTGKTRLALQAAENMRGEYGGDVAFVNLTPIGDPNLVLPTIAQALGIQESAGQALPEAVQFALRDRRMLIMLDNFEQVVSAAPAVAALLAAAPLVKALVTSQVVLAVRGEHVYAAPAMALPERKPIAPGADPAGVLHEYEAVRLFVARAQERQAGFSLTAGNAGYVVEICHLLDGLPLAIELAAARVAMFPPGAMVDALRANLLKPLKGATQDAPGRHRTLGAAIAWSYSLLAEAEQRLFRRLSVFVGGFTLEAMAAVCGVDDGGDSGGGGGADADPAMDVADGLESLVNKSLAWATEAEDGRPRYWQLSTIHAYGSEALAQSGEQYERQKRHAAFFARLAALSRPHLRGADQALWLKRLEAEHDNFRAAIDWSCHASAQAELALRVVGDLGLFWEMHGHLTEGRTSIAQALAADSAAQATEARIKALSEAGNLASFQGDYAAAGKNYEEALTASRQSGNKLHEMYLLINLGSVATERGAYSVARSYLEESLATQRNMNNLGGMAAALLYLGELARCEEDFAAAEKAYLESLALYRQQEDISAVAWTLHNLACVCRHRGDTEQAANLFRQSLGLFRPLGYLRGLTACLIGFAGIAADRNNVELSVRLFGAATSHKERAGISTSPADRRQYDEDLACVQAPMSPAAFQAAWLAGKTMTLEQAFDLTSHL